MRALIAAAVASVAEAIVSATLCPSSRRQASGRQSIQSVSPSPRATSQMVMRWSEELHPSLLPDGSAPVMLEEKSTFPSFKRRE